MSEQPTGRLPRGEAPQALSQVEVSAGADHPRAVQGVDHAGPAAPADQAPLAECVRRSLDEYFQALSGHPATDLYELVLKEVERPLLEVVMRESRNNLCRAAAMLGLNRATLRKKLQKHGLDPRQR